MTNEHNALHTRRLAPLERLLRDLTALGRCDPTRPRAGERLVATLGGDLLAALHDELNGLDHSGLPLGTRPRRIA